MTFAIIGTGAVAKSIEGRATVIDGETIEIHSTRIRLNGIDAPESSQLCLDAAGKKYRCGQIASLALADFLEGHRPTSCIEVARDRYKRMVAVCTAGGVDIGEWVVRQGHALDWPKYKRRLLCSGRKPGRPSAASGLAHLRGHGNGASSTDNRASIQRSGGRDRRGKSWEGARHAAFVDRAQANYS